MVGIIGSLLSFPRSSTHICCFISELLLWCVQNSLYGYSCMALFIEFGEGLSQGCYCLHNSPVSSLLLYLVSAVFVGMGTETRYLIGLGAKLWKTGVSISSDVNGSVIGTGEIKKTHIHLLLLYIYIYIHTLSCKFYPARVTSCFYMQ